MGSGRPGRLRSRQERGAMLRVGLESVGLLVHALKRLRCQFCGFLGGGGWPGIATRLTPGGKGSEQFKPSLAR
jgi:hypothetical protein